MTGSELLDALTDVLEELRAILPEVAYPNKLSHALPGDLSTDRIYADSTTDLDRILGQIRRERA